MKTIWIKAKRRWGLRAIVFASIVALLSVVLYFGFEWRIRPIVATNAEASVRSLTARMMNNAVLEKLGSSVAYGDLVDVVVDQEGRVSMLQGKTATMNRIGAEVALLTQQKISEAGEQGINVRLGSALGSAMFSNRGPAIRVAISPAGSVTSSFVSKFESAGINQTLHRINLRLEAKVRILLGGRTVETVEVVGEVPVAESLIVGVVPETYVNVPEVGDALNLVP